MTRTKTLVIIGCFMLALAVLAALELRSGESVLVEGQVVTGALSKEAPTPAGAIQDDEIESSSRAGSLLPLDNGTLRTSTAEKPSARVDDASSSSSEKNTATSSNALPQTAVTPALQALPSTPVLAVNGKSSPQLEPSTSTPAAIKPVAESAPSNNGKVAGKVEESKASKPSNGVEVTKSVNSTDASKSADAPKLPAAAPKNTTDTASTTPVSTAKTPTSKIITTSAPEKLLPGEKAIIWTHLEMEPKQVVFRFTGASAIDGKAFMLAGPDRYVVDLKGSWAFDLPKVSANAFVKSIRAGRQETNTRLVFDLTKPLNNCLLVKVNKDTLEIRLR